LIILGNTQLDDPWETWGTKLLNTVHRLKLKNWGAPLFPCVQEVERSALEFNLLSLAARILLLILKLLPLLTTQASGGGNAGSSFEAMRH